MTMPLNKKILSMIMVPHHPHLMKEFLENIKQTVDNLSCIEVLIKIDEEDHVMRALLDDAIQTYRFDIRYLLLPCLKMYDDLPTVYQQLFNIANQDSYYIQIASEEIRFKTQGWDTILNNYIHFFQDDIFRLKIAQHKFRNYYSFHDCGPAADQYAFISRKWLELSGGLGQSSEFSSWHQHIDYHLGQTKGINDIPGLFRSIPMNEIVLEEDAVNKLLSQNNDMTTDDHFQEWSRMYSVKAQQKFRRIATKMLAYIWAKNENLQDFSIKENTFINRVTVIDNKTSNSLKGFFYHVSSFHIRLQNFYFLIKIIRMNRMGFQKAFLEPCLETGRGLFGSMKKFYRHQAFCLAKMLSSIITRAESIQKHR